MQPLPLPSPGPLGPLEIRPLHASEMRLYLACPQKHHFAHHDRRVPVLRHKALQRGTDVHVWLSHWWMGEDASPWLPEDPAVLAACLGYDAVYGSSASSRGSPHLREVRVNVPFEAVVGGVRCAGTLDALGRDDRDALVIVEHKTTSSDIAPGEVYWRQVVTTDLQVSMYQAAFPGSTILYDVLRKPTIRQRKVPTKTLPVETDEEYVARCLEWIEDDHARYYQRATVVRLESEDEAFARDVRLVDALRRLPQAPRNSASCFSYGTRCGYHDVCWGSASLLDPEFTDQEASR